MRLPGAGGPSRAPGFSAESSISASPGTYRTRVASSPPPDHPVRTAQALVDYDRRWPAVFEAERRRISAALGPGAVAIEHVGSSSVPGLAGRPEIDILVGLASRNVLEASARSLEALGYSTSSSSAADGWCLLAKPGRIPFEVLVVEHGGPLWRRHLGFREYLRRDPARAARYSRLKAEWAARYGAGTDGYKEAKRRFWIAVGESTRHRHREMTASS
jgi:GrpB-like predicted nucleotidyltransferase (UPF0157 family)